MVMCCLELVLLGGEKHFKPRPQNRILVPLRGFFQKFPRRAPQFLFIVEFPRGLFSPPLFSICSFSKKEQNGHRGRFIKFTSRVVNDVGYSSYINRNWLLVSAICRFFSVGFDSGGLAEVRIPYDIPC